MTFDVRIMLPASCDMNLNIVLITDIQGKLKGTIGTPCAPPSLSESAPTLRHVSRISKTLSVTSPTLNCNAATLGCFAHPCLSPIRAEHATSRLRPLFCSNFLILGQHVFKFSIPHRVPKSKVACVVQGADRIGI